MTNVTPNAPMKVYGWAGDFTGCGYYRIGLPLKALSDIGHQTLASNQLRLDLLDPQIVIGQRVMNDGPSQTWQKLAQSGKYRLAYEIDDDLFNVDPSNKAAYNVFRLPDVKERIQKNASVADMVIVTTEPLAEVMRQYNDNVVVIPNFIDESVLNITAEPNERTVIGWAGSTTHAMDFAEAGKMLKKVSVRLPEVDFHFAGADYGKRLFPTQRYKFTGFFSDIFDHYRNVATFDIGLAPLKPHVFNRAKSPLKALEYAALGIPCVASRYWPYESFIRHGETGFLVKQDYDWLRHITTLVKDRETYEAMSTAAKAQARRNTIQANVHLWENALRSLF